MESHHSSRLKKFPLSFCSLSSRESSLLILGLKLVGSLLKVILSKFKNLFIPDTRLCGEFALHLTPGTPSYTITLHYILITDRRDTTT
jgi:hypothetical protein